LYWQGTVVGPGQAVPSTGSAWGQGSVPPELDEPLAPLLELVDVVLEVLPDVVLELVLDAPLDDELFDEELPPPAPDEELLVAPPLPLPEVDVLPLVLLAPLPLLDPESAPLLVLADVLAVAPVPSLPPLPKSAPLLLPQAPISETDTHPNKIHALEAALMGTPPGKQRKKREERQRASGTSRAASKRFESLAPTHVSRRGAVALLTPVRPP
jgi:hypothetical protein